MVTGAVTGLASEAAIARRIGLIAAAGAGTRAGTEAAIAELVAAGVPGLVSFGIAGGLAPALSPGTLLLPPAVRSVSGEGYFVDVEWHARLRAAARAGALSVVVGGMLGADRIAATAEAKARVHSETGAIAVDLESHLVAAAARRARLPFVILRAIADPANRTLPKAALIPLAQGGEPRLLRVLGSLVREPWQISGLLELRRDARAALVALEQGARALGSALSRLEHSVD
jgi:hopanoid-associated phosphorylase